jgi:hypothetical protein
MVLVTREFHERLPLLSIVYSLSIGVHLSSRDFSSFKIFNFFEYSSFSHFFASTSFFNNEALFFLVFSAVSAFLLVSNSNFLSSGTSFSDIVGSVLIFVSNDQSVFSTLSQGASLNTLCCAVDNAMILSPTV